MKRTKAVELFWKWHPRLYRLSGGRIGGKLANLPVLLLETQGRKSGLTRETALTYLPWDDHFVVIASVLGEPNHPAWYHNLKADPKIAIQVGSARIAVEADEAEGDEREAIWNELIERSPGYTEYKDRTGRRIPVVVLRRRNR